MSGIPMELVYHGNQIQLQPCSLYKHTHPMTEQHHVCPESWWFNAKKPVGSPLMQLCPDCHYGVHVAIDGLIRKKDVSLLKMRWIELAQKAFTIAQENGLTPTPTL